MYSHDTSTAAVACKNWHPDTTSGTYLPPNTREASYAISPNDSVFFPGDGASIGHVANTCINLGRDKCVSSYQWIL